VSTRPFPPRREGPGDEANRTRTHIDDRWKFQYLADFALRTCAGGGIKLKSRHHPKETILSDKLCRHLGES
jgi:hypothetical protein